MSISVGYYVEWLKLSGVVVLSSEWWEEKGGLEDEHTVEEVVALRDDLPRRLTVHSVRRVLQLPRERVESEEPISREEYEALRAEHGIADTAEVRTKLIRRREIWEELEHLAPQCPRCDAKMVQRAGPHGDFWGCPRYPKCEGTRSIKAQVRGTLARLQRELAKYHDL